MVKQKRSAGRDRLQFPPFQCWDRHLLLRKDEAPTPNARERERTVGFPVDSTYNCLNETETKRSPIHHGEWMTLPASPFFLPSTPCAYRALLGHHRLKLQVLAGQSLKHGAALVCWRALHQARGLVHKLLTQVSGEGEDLLVSLGASTRSYQEFRNSKPASLWSWREICGWKWGPCDDHINRLELRAIYTTLRRRVLHQNNPHVLVYNCHLSPD